MRVPFNRAQRRADTFRICSYRKGRHPKLWPDRELGRYAKFAGGCRCSRQHHGAPRSACKMCYIGHRDGIYQGRQTVREASIAICRHGVDPDILF